MHACVTVLCTHACCENSMWCLVMVLWLSAASHASTAPCQGCRTGCRHNQGLRAGRCCVATCMHDPLSACHARRGVVWEQNQIHGYFCGTVYQVFHKKAPDAQRGWPGREHSGPCYFRHAINSAFAPVRPARPARLFVAGGRRAVGGSMAARAGRWAAAAAAGGRAGRGCGTSA